MGEETDYSKRFTDRVANYAKYRPGYPQSVLNILERKIGFKNSLLVADIGSGTGLGSKLLLDYGCSVIGIEPEDGMRGAGEEFLKDYEKFESRKGYAEATTLEDNSVDVIVSFQAFHWFQPIHFKNEVRRILRDEGWVILIWNSRKRGGSAFLDEYEELHRTFGTDYKEVNEKDVKDPALKAFFDEYSEFNTSQYQDLDFEALKGRLLSSSYIPLEGHADYNLMMRALTLIFEKYNENGKIRIDYDTNVVIGKV